MMLRTSIAFEAPLEKVWALFTDPDLWSQWNTEWAEIRDVRGPFDHVAAGYTQVFGVLGYERRGTWEVSACEPKRWREVVGTMPLGIPFHARDEFRDTPSGGTEVVLALAWEMPWGGVGRVVERVAVPLLQRQLRGNASRAARLLSRTGSVSPLGNRPAPPAR